MLIVYRGRAGDRNERALHGSLLLAAAIAERFHLDSPQVIGEPQPPLHGGWKAELAAACAELGQLANAVRRRLLAGDSLVSVIGRCAAGLATLPVVARHRPDACVVWFDAHADSNTPTSVSDPYLGGMVISAATGMWESGLGKGLEISNVVLVGSRDIDPDEQELIDAGRLTLVRVGPDLPARLAAAVRGRAVYVHLDCDVLEPGIVPTEYRSPGGLSLPDLQQAFTALAQGEIVGLEIAEFEATWPDDPHPVSPANLVSALEPLLQVLCEEGP